MNEKEYQKEYYKKNKEKLKAYGDQWRKNNREYVLKYERKASREYYQNNKEEINKKSKEYQRKHCLSEIKNGKRIMYYSLIKRNYPKDNCCELCKNKKRRLSYHHWKIEKNIAFGLWVCTACHNLAERIYLVKKFLTLVDEINNNIQLSN